MVPYVQTGRYIAASINYRLSEHGIWPAQMHDCKAAIRWLRGHAETYGIDADKIGVIGTSAGGHLVAMLGTSGGINDLEGALGAHRDQSSRVSAVVDYFGPTDFLTMNDFPGRMDHDAPDSPESKLIGGPIQERKRRVRSASPLNFVTADDAPTLIVHGADDPLVPIDQSIRLHRALVSVDVPAAMITVRGGRARRISQSGDQRNRFQVLGNTSARRQCIHCGQAAVKLTTA